MGSKDVLRKITHVIFDVDGLLVDSEGIYTTVNEKLLQSYDRKFTMDMKNHMMGMRKADAVKWLLSTVGLMDKVSVEEYDKSYDHLLAAALPNCELMPGALRLVRHLNAHNVPIALCTGSNSVEFNAKMINHKELLELFPLRVLIGDDMSIKRSKPAPDGFLAAMNLFAKRPAETANVLVFEDSVNGVRAAVAAGMNVIMVPDLTNTKPPEDCIDKIAYVLKSLEDFIPESVGLPPY
ncbi:unnamed protein product [Thelazia callipaeda]|uniref:HAD hydrolase, family IA, variant 3 n=1 Tax=Thelazia callipaeda TaxID=103827 RepID=A0A0N5DAB0_THECL|nr:unnamed protein product [Thelazia callipaeda]